MNDIPFVRNVASLLGLGDETLPWPDFGGGIAGIVDAAKNDGFFSASTAWAAGQLAGQLIPGGRQGIKTATGLQTMVRGGKASGFGDEKRLTYAVDDDANEWIRALIFGNAGLRETEEYYASGASGLSVAETALYSELTAAGEDNITVYDAIQELRGVKGDKDENGDTISGSAEVKAIAALGASGLGPEAQGALYSGMVASDAAIEQMEQLALIDIGAPEYMQFRAEYATLAGDKDVNGDTIPGSKTNKALDIIGGLALTDAQRFELYSVAVSDSRDEEFNTLRDTGMGWDQISAAYREYNVISADSEMTAPQQATAYALWVDEQDYTADQEQTVKATYKYYSIIPAEATRYAALTEAGLASDTAYGLTETLAALEPEPGYTNVTDNQRIEAIAAYDAREQDKVAAIGTIMGTEMTTDSGEPSQYAMMLDVLDAGLELDDYVDIRQLGGVGRYLDFTDAGAGSRAAMDMTRALAALGPEEGEDEVSRLQRLRAVVDSGVAEDDQMAAMSAMMQEAEYFKLQTGYQYGVTPYLYVGLKESLPDFNVDGNKNYTQKEVEAAIDAMWGLTTSERAALWQIQNKSWKGRSNPYSTSVGTNIYNVLQSYTEEDEDADERESASSGLPDL